MRVPRIPRQIRALADSARPEDASLLPRRDRRSRSVARPFAMVAALASVVALTFGGVLAAPALALEPDSAETADAAAGKTPEDAAAVETPAVETPVDETNVGGADDGDTEEAETDTPVVDAGTDAAGAAEDPAASAVALAAASSGFATGGSGRFKDSIDWFQWGGDGDLIPMSGMTRTNTRIVNGQELATTCTVSNPTGQLKAYRSGDWGGDGLDDMYNIGGTGTANQLVAGLANHVSGTQVAFGFSCSVTLDGVPVPLAGLVMADAEASTSNEWVRATASAGANWTIIDRTRTAGCTDDRNIVRSGTTLTFSGSAVQCATYPTGVAFMQGATSAQVSVSGGGVSAVALGVMLFTDFGDAPESYGEAGALYSPGFTGGVVPEGTSTLFGGNTLANLAQPTPRLGAAVTSENAPRYSANAGADTDDALVTPLAPITQIPGEKYTLSGIAATGGTVRGWIDWNRNGTFDAGEESAAVAPAGGTLSLTWTVPADAVSGATFLRLRSGSNAAAVSSPVGLTTSGEVEDYPVTLSVIDPFGCTANAPGLLFQRAPSDLISIDLVTGEYTTQPSLYAENINAVGYNVLDGYIYGYTTTTSPFSLVRVGSNGSVQRLGPVPGVANASYLLGDVDQNGHFWIMSGSTGPWYEIDLAPGSPTYMTVLSSGPAPTPLAGISIGVDWARVPGGGNHLYAIGAQTANGQAVLVRFNLATHQWENRGPLGYSVMNGTAVDLPGAVYADSTGNLYGSYNGTGRIYRITVNSTGNSTAALFSQGPASGLNDGARCADSPIVLDFGDAPDSYGTSLAANGPRHGIPGYDTDAHTAPLMIGRTIDADNDGRPGPRADGDDLADVDDEDGVASEIVAIAGSPTTVTVTATNDTGADATLAGWLDLNGNGTFEIGERVTLTVPAGSGTADYTLEFPSGSMLTDTFARFRLFGGAVADPQPTGATSSGEVEDYRVTVVPLLACDGDGSLFNTAWNAAAGSTVAPGGRDLNWDVAVGTPAGPSSVASWTDAYVPLVRNALWTAPPLGNADWITYSPTTTHAGNIDIFLRYRFEIDPTVVLDDFALPMDFYADNSVPEIWVNGVTQSGPGTGLPQATSGDPYYWNGFQAGRQAATTLTGFQHGMNEIVVQVVSAAPEVGFMAALRPQPALCTIPATLQVQKVGEDSTGTVVAMDGSAWAVYDAEAEGSVKIADLAAATDASGATLTGLFRDGTLRQGSYWLEETRALDGFELLANRIPFTVAVDGTVSLGATSSNVTLVDIDGVPTIRIEDIPKLDLPETGGIGAGTVYAVGGILVALASALPLIMAFRRRRASAHPNS